MRVPLVLALLLAVPLSGCVGTEASPKTLEPTTSTVLGYGSLEGFLRDEQGDPVANATVTILGGPASEMLRTDVEGYFAMGSILEGGYILLVEHERHVALEWPVAVTASKTTTLELVLELRPDYQPYVRVLPPMRGQYTCAVEALILTGDCMLAWYYAFGEDDPITEEKNYFFFNVDPRWSALVAELEWRQTGNNALEGMRLYLAPANESRNPAEHHTKIARAQGPESPLRIVLERGAPHATAEKYPNSDVKAVVPDEGLEIIALVYPRGNLYEYTSQVCEPQKPDRCLLGVGAGLSVDFTLHITLFYNDAVMPPNYSAVP
jgi:hypothetical protein